MLSALKPFAALIVRHLLTVIAGILIGKGLLQAAQLDTFIGMGVMVAGLFWSAWEKLMQPTVLTHLNACAAARAAKTTNRYPPVEEPVPVPMPVPGGLPG